MKIVFISGPLTTGGDGSIAYIEKNVKIAEQYAFALAKKGIGFFCAHTHTSNHYGNAPEPFYYELDTEILKRSADALLAIPGWEKSWGATKEVELAKEKGLKVFYPKHPNDIEDIIAWAKS